MISSSQKKALHSLLSTNLKHLTITPPSISSSSSSTTAAVSDFDFSDVFGPAPLLTPHHHAPSTSASPSSAWDPPVIHNRSHSFVGPSPRYTTAPPSLPFLIQEELEPEEEEEVDLEQNDVVLIDQSKNAETSNRSSSVTTSTNSSGGGEGQNGKLGPGDFEIMRVVGRGAFGKVFQVRMKEKRGESESSHCGGGGGGGDGVYAMKVMRKDSIIKKKHVDYMKAERDILTKVVHPFVVQLRFSFQVPIFPSPFRSEVR